MALVYGEIKAFQGLDKAADGPVFVITPEPARFVSEHAHGVLALCPLIEGGIKLGRHSRLIIAGDLSKREGEKGRKTSLIEEMTEALKRAMKDAEGEVYLFDTGPIDTSALLLPSWGIIAHIDIFDPNLVTTHLEPVHLYHGEDGLKALRAYVGYVIKNAAPSNRGAEKIAEALDIATMPDDRVVAGVMNYLAEEWSGLGPQPTPLTHVTEDKERTVTPEWGAMLLAKDPDAALSYRFFNTLVGGGASGLVISREHPDRVRARYGVQQDVNIFWLSKTTDTLCLSPTNLGKLAFNINNYMKGTPNSVILLEGLEYLINNNTFADVMRWLEDIEENVILTNSIIILPITEGTFERRELALLERNRAILSEEHIQLVDEYMAQAPGEEMLPSGSMPGVHEDAQSVEFEVVEEESGAAAHPYLFVKDVNDNPICGARVEAKVGSTMHTTYTNPQGRADFPTLSGEMFPEGVRFFVSKDGYRSLIWDAGILDSGRRYVMEALDVGELVAEAEKAYEAYDFIRAMRFLRLVHERDPNNAKYWFYRKMWTRELRTKLTHIPSDDDCATCRGSGTCSVCEGSGKCTHCDGGACPNCGGTGHVNSEVCEVCNGQGNCLYCHGSGLCGTCMGTAKCPSCVLPKLQWLCQACGAYVYSPWDGEKGCGVAPWTFFEDVGEEFRCPSCGAPKSDFVRLVPD